MAQLTMNMDVVMDDAVRLRTQLLEEWKSEGLRITYTDLVIRAVAKALEKHPLMNSIFGEREITLKGAINVGMAVAVEDGLLVPVVQDANLRSVGNLVAETAPRECRARGSAVGRRPAGWHLHRNSARHVWRRQLHPDHQCAASGHSRR
jgi:pyruvate dehydrogenase E2 component (dihydrolipoamide acetyltransferase)